jgi:transposase-like protein
MPRAGPPYSPEFRADAVQRLSSGGTTVAELSHELGVSESTLRRWRLQAGEHREEAAGPTIDEPPGSEEPERKDRPSREEGDGTQRADRPPAHPTAPTIEERAVRRRRLAVSHPGKDRSVRILARLTADVIDLGVVVVTAPAKWAASGLRWYADKADGPPARAGGGKDAAGHGGGR